MENAMATTSCTNRGTHSCGFLLLGVGAVEEASRLLFGAEGEPLQVAATSSLTHAIDLEGSSSWYAVFRVAPDDPNSSLPQARSS